MHGGLTAKDAVFEQNVACHACVDSFQGVSPGKCLFPSHEALFCLAHLEFHSINSTPPPYTACQVHFWIFLGNVAN